MKTTRTELIEDLGAAGNFRATLVKDTETSKPHLSIQQYGTDNGGNYKRLGRGITIPVLEAGALLELLNSKCIGEEAPL